MRCVVQRVSCASVTAGEYHEGFSGPGLLVLAGFEASDTVDGLRWMADKLAALRIFSDAQGKMNLNVNQVSGRVLVVSQFTLHAAVRKGNRPSFIRSAPPAVALDLYNVFVEEMRLRIQAGVQTGVFGAAMQVALVNDGPVTLWIDTAHPE